MLLPLNKRKNSHTKHKKTAINSLTENSKILRIKKVVKNKYFLIGLVVFVFVILLSSILYKLLSTKEEVINDYDFSKGVLSLNTDKSEYMVGDTVLFQMGSLDKNGDTLCKSNLQLQISVPGVERKTVLSYDKKQIVTTSTCKEDNNVTNDPDYISRFKVEKAGEYKLLLTNLDTGKKVKSSFKVIKDTPQFNISRNSATRINPFKSDRYPMVIYITAKNDFKGKYVESVPKNFNFTWIGPAKVEETKDNKVLSWELELKAGETKKIVYEYTAPQKSPDFIRYGLGELMINTNGVYKETHSWQIASDAVITTAGSGNWSSTTANAPWPSGTLPLTTDSVVVANGHTLTLDGNQTITVITINLGGTLTFSNNPTLTFTNSSTSVITNNGTYTRNGETIRLSGLNPTGNQTATSGTVSLNNLTINTISSSNTTARTLSLGAGLTVNGNLVIDATGGTSNWTYTIQPSAALVVGGSVTLKGQGSANNKVVFDLTTSNRSLQTTNITVDAWSTINCRASTITLTGTSGTLITRNTNGTLTQGTSTFTVTSASGTLTLNGGTNAAITLNNLTLNTASTSVTLGAALTLNAAGNLNITQGTLADGGFQITCTATCTGTLTLASGTTLKIGSASTATNFPANYSNFSINAASTVTYQGNGAQTISRTPTYGNLRFEPALSVDRTYSFASGTMTVNGDFTAANTGNGFRLTLNLNGTLTIASNKTLSLSPGGTSLTTLSQVANTNTISTGFLNIGSNATLTMITTGGLTLTGVSSTLFTNNGGVSGGFTQATSTVTVTSASGAPILFGGATSTTFYDLTINSAATVVNSGPAFTVSHNFSITSGVFNSSTQLTGPGASGTFTIGATGTYCIGGTSAASTATCDSGTTQTGSVVMPTFQSYSFNSSSTVRYLTDASITVATAPLYGKIYFLPKLTASRVYTMSGALSSNGDFTVNPSASSSFSLTVNLAGAVSVTAGGIATISGTTSATSLIDLRPSSTDYNFQASLLVIGSGGTLDATGAASTITLTGTSGTLFTKTGSFISGSSTVIFNGDGGPTLTSGTFTSTDAFYNLSITPNLTSVARTYAMGSGDLELNGDFTIAPTGTQTLAVNMSGNITVANTKTTAVSGSATATLATTSANPALSTGNLNIGTNGVLSGTSSTSTITLTANSTPFTNTGIYTPGSTTISYTPASTSGVTVTSGTYYNITFNKSGNTFSLTTSGITVTNDLTITAGVLDAVSGSNFPITVGRDWTNTPGTGGFLPQQGTVTFNTTTTATITGTTNFYNFTAATAGKTIKFANSTTFTTSGLLTLTGSAVGPSYVTLDSSNGSPSWTINHQGTESITYATIKNSTCDNSSTNITAYTSAGNVDGTGNGTCWLFEAPVFASSFYKFDEGQGTVAYDASGLGNSGTLAGSTKPTWQSEDLCVSGKCLYFNGSTATVTAGSVTVKTVSFWVKPSSLTNTFLQLTATKYISSNSSGVISASGYSNSIIYVNGVPKTTIEANKWQLITVTTSSSITADAIIIGNNSTNYYQGFMDEVKFNNTEYTDTQVKSDYSKNGNVDPVSASFGPDNTWLSNGLVGYWKMNESSGDISDSSGLGNSLTNNGTTTFVAGKFGKGSEYVPASLHYFSLSGSAVASYYFNASDSGPTDSSAGWTNDANAYDGNTGTYASHSSSSSGVWVMTAAGTNAPTSGSTITQVRSRVYGCASGQNLIQAYTVQDGVDPLSTGGAFANTCPTNSWSTYVTLSAPSGGWTWQKINDLTLVVRLENDFEPAASAQFAKLELEVTSSGGGSMPNVGSISFWTNPDSTTNYYLSLTSGAYITSSSGTLSATGLNNAKIYVNGVESSVIVADQWQHVVVTFDSISPDQFYIGRQGSNYYDGTLDEVRVYNRILSPAEVSKLYNWAPGPVGYWNFNENTGTGASDTSGNSNNSSSFSGNPTWSTGKFGSALSFDGTGDYITIPANSTLGLLSNLTVEAWVYPRGVASSTIIDKTGGSNAGWTLQNQSGDYKFTVNFTGNDLICTAPVGSVVDSAWQHIAVSYDGGSTCASVLFYINSVPQTLTESLPTGTRENDTSSALLMGDNGLGNNLTGDLDEVRIYNYIRSNDQVIEDMNGGHPVGGSPVGSPVAYYKFDKVASNSAEDNSINANTLSLCNTTSCANATAASWTGNGKFSGAWNGTGSVWLSRADDSDFDFAAADSFTIAGWFKSDSASNPGTTEYLVNKANATTAGYALYFNTSGQVCFGIDDDTSWGPDVASCSSSDYYDGTWHNFIAIRNTSSDVTKIYVDASLKDSDTDPTTATLANSLSLYVGDRDGTDNGDEFNGDIDELKFYRASLTDPQVKIEYNKASSVKFGTTSTTSTPSVASDSLNREFCIPGDTTTCTPPLVYMKFDENTGTTTTYDSSGNGFSGAMSGFTSSSWAPGKVGSALSFSSSVVDVTDNGTLLPTGAITVSAWVNFRTLTAGSPERIVRKMCTTAPCSSNSSYALELNNSTLDSLRFTIFVGGSAVYVRSAASIVTTNTWYHVAGVYDSAAGTIKIYLNGVDVSALVSGTPSGDLQGDNAAGALLRMGGNSTSSNTLDGLADEVKVYDYARSPAQLLLDYNKGKPFAWYKFDECTGTSINDDMGNTAAGTLTLGAGGTTTAGTCSTSGSWFNGATGKVNSAMDFDGVDDYITVTNTSVIDADLGLSKGFSASAWIYADTAGEGTGGRIFTKNTNTWCRVDTLSGSDLDVECSLDLSTDATLNIPAALKTGRWNHVVVTWSDDSDDEISVYVNGVLRGTSTNGVGPVSTDSANLIIGNDSTSGTATFDGRIDDFRIFGYELSPIQIKSIYNNGAASFKQ